MTNTPPNPHRASDISYLNSRRPSPRHTPEPTHSSSSTNPPHPNTSFPKQTFNPDGTRKYLNIRPAGGQPFPLKKGKKYLAEDYKDGIAVKKEEKGATSSILKKETKSNRAADSDSEMQDKERVIKQEFVPVSRQLSSVDSDSSPERPLIEVLRSMRRDGGGSASGGVGRSGGAGEESEDERGRKMGRDVGKRGGGTRGGK